MAEYDDWDDDDLGDAPKDSNALRELRKANKAKEKQIKELMEKLENTSKAVRERSVKDVLNSKGLNSKIAAFIPSNLSSTEEVEAWVEEYGEVFGSPAAQPSSAGEVAQPNPDLQALGRIASTQSSGQPFTNDPTQIASLINSATTPEELNKVLFGNSTGPSAY